MIKAHIADHTKYENVIFGLAKHDERIHKDLKSVIKKLNFSQVEATIRMVPQVKPKYEIEFNFDSFYRAKIYGAMQRKMRSVFLLDDNYLRNNSGQILQQ